MSNEVSIALYNALTAGTALTNLLSSNTSVYEAEVPGTATYPVVMFELASGGDLNETPARSKELFYTVEAISETGMLDAANIDAQIDGLLHYKALSVTGWEHVGTWREADWREVDRDYDTNRRKYRVGGQYRVRIAKAV